MVSVRNLAEARIAWESGVDLIDLKEPSAGPLGAVSPAVRSEVASWFSSPAHLGDLPTRPNRAAWSLALGELLDRENAGNGGIDTLPSDPLCTAGGTSFFRWAKFGLSGCATRPGWERVWQAAASRVPPGVELVAVAYADALEAGSPSPQQVLEFAARVGARVCLLDTWDKAGGSLPERIPLPELVQLVQSARAAGIRMALAGSLDLAAIEAILPLEPDWIAVRGAACDGGRSGRVSEEKIAAIRRCLAGQGSGKPLSG